MKHYLTSLNLSQYPSSKIIDKFLLLLKTEKKNKLQESKFGQVNGHFQLSPLLDCSDMTYQLIIYQGHIGSLKNELQMAEQNSRCVWFQTKATRDLSCAASYTTFNLTHLYIIVIKSFPTEDLMEPAQCFLKGYKTYSDL